MIIGDEWRLEKSGKLTISIFCSRWAVGMGQNFGIYIRYKYGASGGQNCS